MTDSGRNTVIGTFVLFGLLVLGLLIIKFNTAADYFGGLRDYYIEIKAEKTAAVLPGQTLHMNGYPIGEIRDVRLAEDPRHGVIITAAVRQKFSIPKDVSTVHIYQAQLGPPWIDIEVLETNSQLMHPTTPGQVVASFKADIPPGAYEQISRLAKQLKPTLDQLGPALTRIGALAENLNLMLAGPEKPDADAPSLQTLAQQFSKTLDNLNSVIGDQQNRDNLKQSLANLSQAGEDASDALKEFKEFAAQAKQSTSQVALDLRDTAQSVIDSSQQISQLLRHLDQAVQQVNQGKGTAGKMITDPALYEEMLSSTENLNQAIQEFRNLLNKWSRDGMKVKW